MVADKTIRIKAVGDISPGDHIAPGFGVLNITIKYGCDFLFEKIRDGLQGADLLMGNLEGTLSSISRKKNLRMCGLPEMAQSLKKAGFDVLSVANNHVLDHGLDIFHETILLCRQAGLMVCGLRDASEYYSQPVILEKHGLNIGILAYNWVWSENNIHAGDHIAQIYDGVVNYTWNRNRSENVKARKEIEIRNRYVINDIKELRRHVDIVIIMPHWGYEWVIYPPMGVISEARSFVDAGADVILGAHPHVNQAVEIYKNKIIAYSLGNFLFDGFAREYGSGMMISCKVSPSEVIEHELLILDRDDFLRPSLATAKITSRHMELIRKSCVVIASPDAERLLDDDTIYREYEKEYNRLKCVKALSLLRMAIRRPSTLRVIGQKLYNFLQFLVMLLQGRRVRW